MWHPRQLFLRETLRVLGPTQRSMCIATKCALPSPSKSPPAIADVREPGTLSAEETFPANGVDDEPVFGNKISCESNVAGNYNMTSTSKVENAVPPQSMLVSSTPPRKDELGDNKGCGIPTHRRHIPSATSMSLSESRSTAVNPRGKLNLVVDVMVSVISTPRPLFAVKLPVPLLEWYATRHD